MERLATLESGLQVAASWASLLYVYIVFFFLGGGGGGGGGGQLSPLAPCSAALQELIFISPKIR